MTEMVSAFKLSNEAQNDAGNKAYRVEATGKNEQFTSINGNFGKY